MKKALDEVQFGVGMEPTVNNGEHFGRALAKLLEEDAELREHLRVELGKVGVDIPDSFGGYKFNVTHKGEDNG